MPNDTPVPLRPTSPHLTIYRPQISSVLSIMHRMTGLVLAVGISLLVVWLWSAAYNPAFFGTLHSWLASPLGLLLLFGWTLSFYYHFANGVRHLFWDIGKGFALHQMEKSGWAVLVFTFMMSAVTWGFVYGATGGQ